MTITVEILSNPGSFNDFKECFGLKGVEVIDEFSLSLEDLHDRKKLPTE
jgi:hypothetical protein